MKKFGMLQWVSIEKDLLFLNQLIFTLYDKNHTYVHGDERMTYYSNSKEFSNLYGFQLGIGGSYGNNLKNIKFPEIVHHYACIVNDGVHGGSGGSIYRRWVTGRE